MRHIFLISCSKKKGARRAPAEQLYTNPLFKLSLRYARSQNPDAIYILSAKHGLVPLDEQLVPYDNTLHSLHSEQRTVWGNRVAEQLSLVSDIASDSFTILAGELYMQPLRAHIHHINLPLKGLGLGKRLAYLKAHV